MRLFDPTPIPPHPEGGIGAIPVRIPLFQPRSDIPRAHVTANDLSLYPSPQMTCPFIGGMNRGDRSWAARTRHPTKGQVICFRQQIFGTLSDNKNRKHLI